MTRWLWKHYAVIDQHISTNEPEIAPSKDWWVVVFIVRRISEEATATFRSLEGMSTLVSHQRSALTELAVRYLSWFGGEKVTPTSPTAGDWVVSTSGKFRMEPQGMKKFLINLGSHVIYCLNTMEADVVKCMIEDLCNTTLQLIENITDIVVERDSSNEPCTSTTYPAVLPFELVEMSGRDFSVLLQKQRKRLSYRWKKHKIQAIETQFQELLAFAGRDKILQEKFNKCDPKTSFEEAWDMVGSRFEDLREFCGGLSTAFPGTSTVESDFSVVKGEKDIHRSSLTDLSLEGILHTKQFEELSSIGLE